MTLEDKIFEQVLNMIEKAGIKPKLDENARKLHEEITKYVISCWDCKNIN